MKTMLLRRTAAAGVLSVFSTTIFRQLSSVASKISKPFRKIPCKHRSKAIQEAQTAVIDYLHTTRYIPFIYAEHIVSNSPHSLWRIASEIPFCPSTFSKSLQRFLRYHPINELDFFLESIGLDCDEIGHPRSGALANTVFLSEFKKFDVACALSGLGFPWVKLGLLYVEACRIFEIDPCVLERKFNEIKDVYGFSSVNVIGLCLVWPQVLYSDVKDLLSNLKIVFVDCDLAGSVGGNVDAMLEVCRKIRVFYDLVCELEMIGELIGKNIRVLLDQSEDTLMRKIEYFCKLDVRKDEVALLLLSRPEIFDFDTEDREISVSGFLEHFGMKKEKLKLLKQKFPHIFGRNRIVNLPNVMRSMDLGLWFFEKMKNGLHYLFSTYSLCHLDEDLDKHYVENLMKIRAKRTFIHNLGKLNFLHGIGFGENNFAVKSLALLNSNKGQLQQRYDYLLHCGIEYSKLCAMVKLSANILNQQEKVLQQKIEFLCKDMGSSLQYLDVFPAYLCFDLERRVKPRYRLHKWIVENGFCEKEYSISTIVASSEKAFNARISRIHPAAARKIVECSH